MPKRGKQAGPRPLVIANAAWCWSSWPAVMSHACAGLPDRGRRPRVSVIRPGGSCPGGATADPGVAAEALVDLTQGPSQGRPTPVELLRGSEPVLDIFYAGSDLVDGSRAPADLVGQTLESISVEASQA